MQKGAQAESSRASAAHSYAQAARTRALPLSPAGGASAGGGFGKAPSGYRFDADGNLEAIPGGPADKKPAAGGTRPPNNEQTLAAGFANRMVASTKELDNLIANGYDPTNFRDRTAQAVGGYLGNEALSDTGQQFRQAATNWVRANLRKESGAAIGKDEMDQEIENYFPKAGDSQATVEQKARNRALVNQNMIQAAGPAWRGTAPTPTSSAPSPAAAVAPAAGSGAGHRVGDILTVNGRQYRVTGGDPTDPDLEAL
jgi:hypothetical protein